MFTHSSLFLLSHSCILVVLCCIMISVTCFLDSQPIPHCEQSPSQLWNLFLPEECVPCRENVTQWQRLPRQSGHESVYLREHTVRLWVTYTIGVMWGIFFSCCLFTCVYGDMHFDGVHCHVVVTVMNCYLLGLQNIAVSGCCLCCCTLYYTEFWIMVLRNVWQCSLVHRY